MKTDCPAVVPPDPIPPPPVFLVGVIPPAVELLVVVEAAVVVVVLFRVMPANPGSSQSLPLLHRSSRQVQAVTVTLNTPAIPGRSPEEV